MTTQVIFKIDKVIKKEAQKVTKQYGSTYSAFLQQATYGLLDGSIRPGLLQLPEEKFNAKTLRELKKISKDIKEGKNLSPVFNNAKDAIAYLKTRHAR